MKPLAVWFVPRGEGLAYPTGTDSPGGGRGTDRPIRSAGRRCHSAPKPGEDEITSPAGGPSRIAPSAASGDRRTLGFSGAAHGAGPRRWGRTTRPRAEPIRRAVEGGGQPDRLRRFPEKSLQPAEGGGDPAHPRSSRSTVRSFTRPPRGWKPARGPEPAGSLVGVRFPRDPPSRAGARPPREPRAQRRCSDGQRRARSPRRGASAVRRPAAADPDSRRQRRRRPGSPRSPGGTRGSPAWSGGTASVNSAAVFKYGQPRKSSVSSHSATASKKSGMIAAGGAPWASARARTRSNQRARGSRSQATTRSSFDGKWR